MREAKPSSTRADPSPLQREAAAAAEVEEKAAVAEVEEKEEVVVEG